MLAEVIAYQGDEMALPHQNTPRPDVKKSPKVDKPLPYSRHMNKANG